MKQFVGKETDNSKGINEIRNIKFCTLNQIVLFLIFTLNIYDACSAVACALL